MAGVLLIIIIVIMWVGLGLTAKKRQAQNDHNSSINRTQQKDDGHKRLTCQVDLLRQATESGQEDIFSIRIRGQINAPEAGHETDAQVILSDITENESFAQPVLCTVQKWQMEDSPAFYHRDYYGKLMQRLSMLSYWTAVLELPCNTLTLPRRGTRRLKFTVSLLSRGTENEIASASTIITYKSSRPGYIDITENARVTETLTIQLATAALGPENIENESAGAVLEDWIAGKIESIDDEQARKHVLNRLADTAQDAAILCKSGQGLDTLAICEKLASVSSIADRYAAMELFLQMLACHYNGSPEHNLAATQAAQGLQIEHDKLRAMVQKTLPIMEAEHRDSNFLLGITDDMLSGDIRKKLSSEYKKWNSRVNHPDAKVRAKADFMLELIADARSNCTTEKIAAAGSEDQ
ncbi:hypothetical protein STSP2_03365 [Anaerohalosphaera lusitana]|uniref:Uncharacterized protein n=1 Tax=Anaerohalosphaera lusitana TaxID=1936003 RepID=A0A1U9NRB5_9BACT|nr:hypothetical protein [Anaerohalosphaera lusitana]AQT70160.1 hypothetical protein STSP2_03365 [Anaerohalosphaera lusitana]